MDQEAWVHWDYSPEEWTLFDRMDWRMGRLVAIWLLISLPIALVMALFFFFLGGPPVVGPTFALTLLAVFRVCWLVSVSNSSWGRDRHKARRKRGQPHRVTLSKDGVWLAGTPFPLNGEITKIETRMPPAFQPGDEGSPSVRLALAGTLCYTLN